MKNLIVFINIFLAICFTSCEPEIATEGTTMEPLSFEIEHLPDTTFLNITDTMHFYAAIPNTQKLKNGKVNLGMYLGFIDEIPIKSTGNIEIYNNSDYKLNCNNCQIKGNSQIQNLTLGLYSYPQEDSIRFDFNIVFFKKGTYGILVSSSFYEGEDGKARVGVKFKSDKLGWDLYQN